MAFGLTWGLGVLVVGLAATFSGMWMEIVSLIATAYVGFAPTVTGSIIGGVWGFIDGFIGGAVFAWIYNWLQNRK